VTEELVGAVDEVDDHFESMSAENGMMNLREAKFSRRFLRVQRVRRRCHVPQTMIFLRTITYLAPALAKEDVACADRTSF
jgi:hypothetical protein